MEAKYVLGIDPSLTCTGWAILKKTDTIKYVASGAIKTTTKDPIQTRLLTISQAISNEMHEYNISQAYMEETFVNKNNATSLKLGLVRGAIMLTIVQNNPDINFLEISPNLIKKSITGNGFADKTKVLYMIKHIIPEIKNKEIEKMDESDAIATALAGLFINKG